MNLSGFRQIPAWLWIGSTIPLGWSAYLFFTAPAFAWDIYLVDRPVLPFVIAILFTSIVFFLFIRQLRKQSIKSQGSGTGYSGSEQWLFIGLVGLLARIFLFPGPAILEDDFYRYQWDGQVTAAGLNPYAQPPAKFVVPPVVDKLLDKLGRQPEPVAADFKEIAEQGRETLLRTNNPHISTIYTPLTQLAFAAAQLMTPWQLGGWKLIILLSEIAAFVALLGALRTLGHPAYMVAIYWWNPLALKEFSNSLHMDALLMPLLAVMIWLCVTQRRRWMAVASAFAAAIKLWPLLILPALWRKSRASVIWGGIAGMLALAMMAPQIIALTDHAGLARYTADWQRNSLAFPLLSQILSPFFVEPSRIARIFVAAILGFAAFRYWFQKTKKSDAQIMTAGNLILFLCLLSPTGYPWYALWLLPFAVIMPRTSWLLLITCAPFYYLQFHLQTQVDGENWQWITALFSAGPVWVYLAINWRQKYREKRTVHA